MIFFVFTTLRRFFPQRVKILLWNFHQLFFIHFHRCHRFCKVWTITGVGHGGVFWAPQVQNLKYGYILSCICPITTKNEWHLYLMITNHLSKNQVDWITRSGNILRKVFLEKWHRDLLGRHRSLKIFIFHFFSHF